MSHSIIHNILYEPKLLDRVDMSVLQETDAISIQSLTCYAVQTSWTGLTVSGGESIATWSSNDGEIWSVEDNFIPAGTTGNRMLNVEKAGYRFVKIVYTPGPSTVGTLLVTISGKVI
jgi:hypothetical protein